MKNSKAVPEPVSPEEKQRRRQRFLDLCEKVGPIPLTGGRAIMAWSGPIPPEWQAEIDEQAKQMKLKKQKPAKKRGPKPKKKGLEV